MQFQNRKRYEQTRGTGEIGKMVEAAVDLFQNRKRYEQTRGSRPVLARPNAAQKRLLEKVSKTAPSSKKIVKFLSANFQKTITPSRNYAIFKFWKRFW